MAAFRTLALAEMTPLPALDGALQWLPLRRELDLKAFGMNAYRADAGGLVIEEHSEARLGHEEVYVVLEGAARFTVDGEVRDVRRGSVVHCPDSAAVRSAEALEDGTFVLAVGGRPGAAYERSSWEDAFVALAQVRAGDTSAAIETVEAGIAANPGDPNLHYNGACVYALAGRPDEAVSLLRVAAEIDPVNVREYAEGDTDLDSLRARPDWPL